MRGSTLIKTVSAVGVASLLTSACLSSSSDNGSTSSGSAGTSAAAEDLKGKTVTIWTSVDQPIADGLQKSLTTMATAKGFTIKVQKVANINQVVMTKLTASDRPDIAMIPQPGVVADMVKRKAIVPLDGMLDMTSLKSSMVPGTLEAGTIDGKLYGLLASMNTKSFVWYPKKAWAAQGWTVPTTLDELTKLTADMKAKGQTPWCMGIGSDAATGWPATDWMEDLIMRQAGVEDYKKWVSHEIKFESPTFTNAANYFGDLMFTDGNVAGGRKSIASTPFGTAGNVMFDAKPGCMMYKQGSFITGFFPDAVKANMDAEVGVFYFPGKTAADKPILGGGDLAVMMKDSAAAQEAMRYLADPKVGDDAVAAASSYLSPHKTYDVTKYQGGIAQEVAKISYASSQFLFDGSDAMPGTVGSGAFWKDMTAWISGQEDLPTAEKNIDAAWPAS